MKKPLFSIVLLLSMKALAFLPVPGISVTHDWAYPTFSQNNRNEGCLAPFVDLGLPCIDRSSAYGVSVALLESVYEDDMYGVQFGLVVAASKQDAVGVQLGLLTSASDGFGVQLGCVNLSTNSSRIQVGLGNYTNDGYGVQLGIINISTAHSGVFQLGVVNLNVDRIMPIVNFRW